MAESGPETPETPSLLNVSPDWTGKAGLSASSMISVKSRVKFYFT